MQRCHFARDPSGDRLLGRYFGVDRNRSETPSEAEVGVRSPGAVGLRAHESKCEFLVSSLYYLGHLIDKEGLHPLPDKTQAMAGVTADHIRSWTQRPHLLAPVLNTFGRVDQSKVTPS